MNPIFGNLPGPLDLQLYSGATEVMLLTCNIVNPDGSVACPLDLSGYTAADLQIRTAPGGTLIDELSVANGKITLGGTTGTISVDWTAAAVSAYAFKVAYYDLKLTDSAGNIFYFIGGRIFLTQSVTI